jgi:hypothetical protein
VENKGENKMPVTINEISFGIEIETVGQTRNAVANAIKSVVGGTVEQSSFDVYRVIDACGKIWNVVADGSLTNVPAHLRAEIVSPILSYNDITLLQQVVRAVRHIGSKCDERCGIHLHLSHPDVTPKALANLAKTIYKQEELIYAALGVTQARMARYCKPMNPAFIERITRSTPNTFETLNRQWYGQYNATPRRYDSSRYAILNLNAFFLRGAVEVRAYAGSLHAGKVKAAIQFSMALFTKALNTQAASTKKRKYDPASAKYDFRVFLISSLGMNGDEFKSARKHLLELMPGDSAFKYGRPEKKAKSKKTEEMTEVAEITETGAEMLQSSL